MSAPNEHLPADPDTALLQRIQRFNQPLIVGKLLHDLRNPVHSLRIAVELFGRIAKAGDDAPRLLEKAGRYVGPAESAAIMLSMQVERLARYLNPPPTPGLDPLALDPLLTDVADLLRESTLQLEARVESALPHELSVLADAPRLAHALAHWGLTRLQRCVLRASLDGERVRVTVDGAAKPLPEGAASDFEVQRLIESAGGQCERSVQALTIVLRPA